MKDLSPRAQRLIELTCQVDGPGVARRSRVRAMLSAALATGTVSAVAQATLVGASAGTVKLAGGSTAVLGGLKASALGASVVGWFVTGATLGAAVALSSHYALRQSAAPREVARSEAPQPRVLTRPAVLPPERPSSAPMPSPLPAQTTTAARTGPAVVEPATLAEETRLLDQTQVALRSGNPERALDLVAEYQRRFGAGALREEALAARVIALCRAGRWEAGRLAAAQFSEEFPGSPLWPRVRRSCDPVSGTRSP
jgi:hypothetical protein